MRCVLRRPVIFISSAFGTGIFTAFHLEIGFVPWIIFVTYALAFFVWKKLNETKINTIFVNDRGVYHTYKLICLFMCIAAVGGCRMEISKMVMDNAENIVGNDMYVEGIVRTADKKDGYFVLTVNSDDYEYLVRYYGEIDDDLLYIGSTVKVFGQVQEATGKRNPSCFDYNLYLRSCGIGAMLDAKTIKKMPYNQMSLLQFAARTRGGLESKLSLITDRDTKGLIMAMLFGDKSGLNENVYEEFRKNGTAHVLAVSGLHVGVLYGFFVKLWMGRKGCLFHILILAVLLMYTVLAEFSPSVIRAAVMITLHIVADMLHRRYDLLSAAGITFLSMLIVEPYQLFNTGFQMSFLAIVSIGVILPFAKRYYKGIFLASAAVQLGMMPYTAFIFNYISLSTVIVNVPIVFLAGILLPVSLCMLVSQVLPEGVFEVLVHILEIGCDAMTGINRLFYLEGITSFDVVSPPVWILGVYYGLILLWMSESGKLMRLRKMKKQIIIWMFVIVMAAGGITAATDDGFHKVSVTFVDVGQGDCIHIRTNEGKNYLIDGGGSLNYDIGTGTLKPYLLKNGVRHIDAAFVTHLHQDHYGGIKSLAKDGMIHTIGVYEGNQPIEKKIEKETGADIFYLCAGQKVTLGQDVFLEVIAPERKSTAEYTKLLNDKDNENSSSLIFKLTYMDMDILVTGDIDSEGEAELINRCGKDLKCDILKTPHHGSRFSSSEEFIQATDPSIAVFQVGKNNYGHPDEDVVEAYEQQCLQVYRNDRNGAVGIIISRKGKMKVVKMVD